MESNEIAAKRHKKRKTDCFYPKSGSSETTDGHGWERDSSWAETSFATTRRVNTPGTGIPSLSVLSVKSVVSTAVFGMTDCVFTRQVNVRMGFHMAQHVDFAPFAPLCGHSSFRFWCNAAGPGLKAESSKQTGGRRKSWARRPPYNGAGDDLHPDWGARRICGSLVKRARVAQVEARSGTPPGVRGPKTRFPVVVPPLAPNDHRLPSGNPPGWQPLQSEESKLQIDGPKLVPFSVV